MGGALSDGFAPAAGLPSALGLGSSSPEGLTRYWTISETRRLIGSSGASIYLHQASAEFARSANSSQFLGHLDHQILSVGIQFRAAQIEERALGGFERALFLVLRDFCALSSFMFP
jgi:hypothetical protein